jgi:FKBP-type peptidyl-prolyl cis-trans isomerase (trigger factor)
VIKGALTKVKSSVEKVDACQRKIKVELSAEEVKQVLDEVYEEIGKNARIPGFRVGKAPRGVLEKHHAKQASEEVIKRLLPASYQQAVKDNQLEILLSPEISELKFAVGEAMSYLATVEVYPEVELKPYHNLKIKKKKMEVKEEDVEKALKELQRSRREMQQQGTTPEDAKALPDLDDNFAKEIGYGSLKELRESTRQTLEAYAAHQRKRDMENQLFEQLLKISALEVPRTLAEQQTQTLLRQAKIDLFRQGFAKEEIEKQEGILQEKARSNAARALKISFILGKIAELEKLKISKEEFEERIDALAKQANKTREALLAELEERDLLNSLLIQAQEEKTVEFLLAHCEIENE